MEVTIGAKFQRVKIESIEFIEPRGNIILNGEESYNTVKFNDIKFGISHENLFYLMKHGTIEKGGIYSEEVIIISDRNIIKVLPINSELAYRIITKKDPIKIQLEENRKYLVRKYLNFDEEILLYKGIDENKLLFLNDQAEIFKFSSKKDTIGYCEIIDVKEKVC